jgi:hypothetical protein
VDADHQASAVARHFENSRILLGVRKRIFFLVDETNYTV